MMPTPLAHGVSHRDSVLRHPHARLLVCARRLYEGKPVTPTWIADRFGIGIAAARSDMRWLRMFLPVEIVDGGHGPGQESIIWMEPREQGRDS